MPWTALKKFNSLKIENGLHQSDSYQIFHFLKFKASYWDFHKWSTENYMQFWEEIWHFFGIICSKPYNKVHRFLK